MSWLIDPVLIQVCAHIFMCLPIVQMKQLLLNDFITDEILLSVRFVVCKLNYDINMLLKCKCLC